MYRVYILNNSTNIVKCRENAQKQKDCYLSITIAGCDAWYEVVRRRLVSIKWEYEIFKIKIMLRCIGSPKLDRKWVSRQRQCAKYSPEVAGVRAAELVQWSRSTCVRRDWIQSKGSTGGSSEANRTRCRTSWIPWNDRAGGPRWCRRRPDVRLCEAGMRRTRGSVAVLRGRGAVLILSFDVD